mgnify:CR=1 FL=1
MEKEIINKVAQSGIITLDLAKYIPDVPKAELDIKDFLFKGLILKEKDFREQVKSFDWEIYAGKAVAVFCSTDAIVPHWAYMLLAAHLQPHAHTVVYGSKDTLNAVLVHQAIDKINVESLNDQRVVVKGCGDERVDAVAYTAIAVRLLPVVKSLMYGEPCSTVPVFKKKV